MASRYHQGFYKLKNPKKYQGDPTMVTYRSGWEKGCMLWLDMHPSVLQWSSEELVIPYISPKDGKPHRYFVDFVATFRYKDNTVKTFIIEVKPHKQTLPPTKRGKDEKKFLAEALTYEINQAKWAAANQYAIEKGWKFIVLDEYGMGLKKASK